MNIYECVFIMTTAKGHKRLVGKPIEANSAEEAIQICNKKNNTDVLPEFCKLLGNKNEVHLHKMP